MPYALNRYVIPLVIMSVLAVALFVVLFVFIVFPYRDAQTTIHAKDRTIADYGTKLADVGDRYGQMVKLLGGEPEDLAKVFPEASPTSGAVTYTVWKEHISNSNIIQTVAAPEPDAQEPPPQPGTKYENLAFYVRALESDILYLSEQVSKKGTAKQNAISERTSLENDIALLADRVKGDKQLPQSAKDRVTFIGNATMDMKNNITTLEKTVQDLTTENTSLKDQIAKIDAIYKTRIDDLTKQLDAANAKSNAAEDKANNMSAEVEKLRAQIAEFQKEKESRTSASGPLTDSFANTPAGKVFMIKGLGMDAKGAVDIGDKKLAKSGMVFRVLRDGVEKAKIQLYQVDENASYFRILSLSSPNNPILEGDDVTSPFYRGGKPVPQEFVLVGEFPEPLTKEKIIDRIKEWGGTVADKVTANTKYVIIGGGMISDEIRNDMQFYNVQRITLATVKDFFGE